jgi:hypothetical protein
MRTKTVTFSIPIELNDLLRARVGKRGLSRFVTQALKKALEEEDQQLKAAYLEATNDPERLKISKEWEVIDYEGWE